MTYKLTDEDYQEIKFIEYTSDELGTSLDNLSKQYQDYYGKMIHSDKMNFTGTFMGIMDGADDTYYVVLNKDCTQFYSVVGDLFEGYEFKLIKKPIQKMEVHNV